MDKSRVYLHELVAFVEYKQQKLTKRLRRAEIFLVLERLLPAMQLGALVIIPALSYLLSRLALDPHWEILSLGLRATILTGWWAILGGAFACLVLLIKEAAALYRQCVADARHHSEKPLWHHLNDALEAKRSGRWPLR